MTLWLNLVSYCARSPVQKILPVKSRLLTTQSSTISRRRKLMAISKQTYSTTTEKDTELGDDQFSFKLGTLNLLAPCYKTIKSREKKTWWGGKKESSHPELYLARYDEIFKILESLPPIDFLCLQEFWFQNEIAELFEKRMGDRYIIYKNRRPTRNDGVALLVGRHYNVKDVEYIKFNDIGMRVALLVHVENSSTGKEAIIVTTHLTYLANRIDQYTRMTQANKLGQAIDQYVTSLDKTDVPVLLCGDFNGGSDGPVYKYFNDLGFTSAYKSRHGDEPKVTHIDHKGTLLSVDYIFYRMPAELGCSVINAFLVPRDYNDKEWPNEYKASDHRLVYAEIVVSPKRT